MPGVAPDEWLSELLGRPAWRVDGNLPEPVFALDKITPGPGFFFTRVPTGEIGGLRRFEETGFRVVDVAVTLEAAATALRVGDGAKARHVEPADNAAIIALAAQSFEWSRLHLDPAIPKAVADRSRAEWVANFFTGERGDVLIVAEHEGLPAAFLLGIGPKNGVLTIDLIAVGHGARRLGLGTACIAFASSQLAGVERLRVGTQAANVGSLSFYESLGFRTVATHYVLHLHRS